MPAPTTSDQISVLGSTVRFKGELFADEDLQIHGQIEGTITHTKYLTVGKDGHVKADIRGHIIAVEGRVEGNVTTETSVAITETGHLAGDIRSPSISINDGADFNGKVFMETAKAVRMSMPPERRTSVSGSTDADNTPNSNGAK